MKENETGLGSPALMPNGVQHFLAMGYPRLALARALGIPFAPYLINVRGTFDSPTVTTVPNASNDEKITQDTIIDAMVARLTIDRTPTNAFDTLSDYFLNFQSGIEATLDVTGSPRYAVAPDFTPLSTLADMVNGNAHWPFGWILTYQQALKMAFNARIALPDFPITVVCTFRGWLPVSDMFVQVSNAAAIEKLKELGVPVPTVYGTGC